MLNSRFLIRFLARSIGCRGNVSVAPCVGISPLYSKPCRNLRFIWWLAIIGGLSVSELTRAQSFDCVHNRCNLPSQETYPNLVIGRIMAVATDEQADEVFTWAKDNGYWSIIPDNKQRFLELVQVMSVAIPEGDGEVELSLLMSREEYDSSPLNPGDVVRYTRHPGDEAMTPFFRDADTRPYWDLFGCIAILCRADDEPCPARYFPGVYRFEDGEPLNRLTDQPIPGGQRIDTETFLPLAASGDAAGPTD